MLIVCTGGGGVKGSGMEVSKASLFVIMFLFSSFFSYKLKALREVEEICRVLFEEYNHLYVSGLLQM